MPLRNFMGSVVNASVSLDRAKIVYHDSVRFLIALITIPGTFANFKAYSNQLWGMESNTLR